MGVLRLDLAPPAFGRSAAFVEVRFIQVKGRAGVGVIAVSDNEYRTAVRLKDDYWLYAVFREQGRWRAALVRFQATMTESEVE